MPKYVIYTRVSTKDQGKDGLGIQNQLKICRIVASTGPRDVNAVREYGLGEKGYVLAEVN